CSMTDRIPVTSLMRTSITGADRTGQIWDVSPQGVVGCQATSIDTPIRRSSLLDKLRVACFGHLDRSNQGDTRNLRRPDTPLPLALGDVTGADWQNCDAC